MWTQIGEAFAVAQAPQAVKAHLNRIAHRRNCIVHEGDLKRLIRPQRVTCEPIARPEVDADLDWIEQFVQALAKVCP